MSTIDRRETIVVLVHYGVYGQTDCPYWTMGKAGVHAAL
jgi:hypothetical protein